MKRIIVILIIGILVAAPIVGYILYENYEVLTCGIACGPSAVPSIQSAWSYSLHEEAYCQLGKIASVAVCEVAGNGGQSGNITVNVSNRGGTASENSRVNFAIYSSVPQYINFTSLPTCAYTSSPSLINATSCLISGNSPQSFQFVYAVSASYGASSFREPASITIVMYQTCCWP